MNDFTKEELKTIRYLINNLDEKMLTLNDQNILVQSKIQSMIENYCEHEYQETDSETFIWRCTKCGDE